jgi:cytochrome P450
MDVISDFAYLMPVTVICERMGIPLEDITRFQAWVEDIVAFTDAPASGWAETAEVALSGLTCLSQYFKEIIQHKRDEPGEDMISQLVSPEPWSDALHAQKLLAMCVQLLVGSHDTTSALIGNSLLLLLQNPEVAEQLGARPERIESAIEEFLRYESPAPRNSRIAMADLELGGQQIREGQTVALMLSAANRDPQQFSDPDRLDISRSPNRHLAFGSGAHFCLGAPLARLEGQIAITTILQRLPGLRPVEQSALERPLWHASTGLRMLKTLPVMFDV